MADLNPKQAEIIHRRIAGTVRYLHRSGKCFKEFELANSQLHADVVRAISGIDSLALSLRVASQRSIKPTTTSATRTEPSD